MNRLSSSGMFAAALLALSSAASAQTPASAPVPVRSEEALAILDKHCARCHADEKLQGAYKANGRAAKGFGFVLDVEQMIRRGKLVAGNADGSALFKEVAAGTMPEDVDISACATPTPPANTYCGPSGDEVNKLRVWINGLAAPAAPQPPTVAAGPPGPPGDRRIVPGAGPLPVPPGGPPVQLAPAPPPAERKFISDSDVLRYASNDLNDVLKPLRPNIRYFTITHLFNAGEAEKDLQTYREGFTKLLNALSWKPDVVRPKAVDPYRTVFRVNIDDLGWDAKIWDKIVLNDPYVIFYKDAFFNFLQAETRSIIPVLRADWFTFAASQPPLYHDILRLPATKRDLEKQLGLNVLANIDALRVVRAGFQLSGVSENNRLIERHQIATGAYWESYDFAGSANRQSFISFPLGPKGAFKHFADKFAFEQDGGEVIFALPNGFHAYYLTDAAGNRLDKGPANIVSDRRGQSRRIEVFNGISCMGCHNEGMKEAPLRAGGRPKEFDQVRQVALASALFPGDVKDIIRIIYPEHADFYRLFEADRVAFARAMQQAEVRARGPDPINILFNRFENNLTAELAAAEFGLTKEEFFERLNAAGREAYDLKKRLEFDAVPRDQFVKLFAPLVPLITENKAIDFTELAALLKIAPADANAYKDLAVRPTQVIEQPRQFDLVFYADKATIRVNETVTFAVKSAQDCNLVISSTNAQGKTVVLFPNAQFKQDLIRAGVEYRIPGREIGGFEIYGSKPSTDRVTATCRAGGSIFEGKNLPGGAYVTYERYEDWVKDLRAKDLAVRPAPQTRPAPGPVRPQPAPYAEGTLAQKSVVVTVLP